MAPSSKLGRGKPLKNQTKELLHKLYRYFETEIARDRNSTVTATQLVTHSTGISSNVIKRVVAEYRNKITIKKELKTHSKRRRCKKNIISEDFDAQAIRRVIHNYYIKDEEFPIMKDLYLIVKAEMDYQGSLCTLRRHVAKLGFKWMQKEDNNGILIEKQDYRYPRVQYLTKIESYRSQGRNIVYTGELAIESNRIASKPKQDGSSTILKQPAKSKLVILVAGDRNSIFLNTLFMFDANRRELKDECEYKRENFELFEKWYKFHLLPVLKPNSIVVIDSGNPFHNRISNPTPHYNSPKRDMMDFLTARNVPYSADAYKPQLYQLVLVNKDKYCDYKTDAFLREHGHTVLRMPPNHPDLSPVKNVLIQVKTYIGKDVCLNVESVMKIAKEKLNSITASDWSIATRTAEAEENNLKSIDKVIDEISETALVAEEDSEDSDIEEDSDPESMDSD